MNFKNKKNYRYLVTPVPVYNITADNIMEIWMPSP